MNDDDQKPPSVQPPEIQPQHSKGELAGSDSKIPFPVVGLGASAGGLEAINLLLEALPDPTGMAFMVVQHLDPHHESRLATLLAKKTSMHVVQAKHGLPVEPDHVYVIPHDSDMALLRKKIYLSARNETRGPHLPVDHLFRSLAEEQESRAIGVVLSGTDSDGALGLCEIKAVGGITFAQDARSAGHPGMPRAAADTGAVDFVMAPDEIARRLMEVARHPYLAPARTKAPDGTDDESFRRVLELVHTHVGVDFSQYRDTTIRRRIMRRMALHSHRDLSQYLAMLEQDRDEIDALYRDLLINVTSFFRDPEVFEALKTTVFPAVARGRTPGNPIRVWVPGCSTGQEAYSIAIALIEYFDEKGVRPPMQIFATDLSDHTALEKARAGLYPESIEGEVSPERLRRFFTKEDHSYRIDKSIRDSCVFARQNVTADPPFSHVDLISCRNVLIYLATPLQKRVLPTFHYALNAPGFLLLGNAETVGDHGDLFELVDRAHKLYAKKVTAGRVVSMIHENYRLAPIPSRRAGASGPTSGEFQRESDRILIGRFAPPGVLVNDNLDILQYRGRTHPYLEAPPGEPTTNLMKLAREGLFLELRSLVAAVRANNASQRRENVRVRDGASSRLIDVEVVPVRLPGTPENCYLVLFYEQERENESTPPRAATEAPRDAVAGSGESEQELRETRRELAATKEYLQSLIEQQDAANEELRSANEEILSSNEELQSTNEELETAKEELQSTNEELTTVNEQINFRNQELMQLNNDLTNLLASTTIPLIMVGGDLRIRRFTASARKVLRLVPSDIGRLIGDIQPSILMPELGRMITQVIDDAEPIDREVQDTEGRWFSVRVHPYRTTDNKIDGAVVLALDIDQVKKAGEELGRLSTLLRQQSTLIEMCQDAIIVRDAEGRVVSWNRGAEEMYGYSAAEAQAMNARALQHTAGPPTQQIDEELDRCGTWQGDIRQTRRDRTPLIVQSRQVVVRDDAGRRLAVLEINRDVTESRRGEQALVTEGRRKDEFLAMLSHELRNPIAPIRNAIEILRMAGHEPRALFQAQATLDRQVTQLARMVDDLIDLSRGLNGKIELHREAVPLADAVKTALETCQPILESSGHEVQIALPEQPIEVDADPVRLVQMLTNLLNNAVKYTEPRGRIRIEARLEPAGGRPKDGKGRDEAVIEVIDSGMGIATDFLPHVFEMFAQERRGDARAGLGVGLALVHNLAELHGGSIAAHSDGPGRGSRFTLRLPLATGEKPAATRPAALHFGEPKRVLVVDDNPDQVKTLGMLLELMGHHVKTAMDGEVALQEARSFVPQVILLDIGLPGLDGLEVARRIRKIPQLKKVVLIAQSGWGQEEDRRRSDEAGFDLHLVKPIDFSVLQELFAPPDGRAKASEEG